MRRSYVTLDGLRGVAAMAVMLFHADDFFGELVPHGYLAVDLFFCLSGFVIAHAYDTRLAGELSASRFVLKRVVRFYPLYLMGLGIGVLRELALFATHNPHALSPVELFGAVATGLLFLPFPVADRPQMFSLNIPSWSLFFELVVNALYAWLFPLLTLRALFGVALVSGGVLATLIVWAGTADLGASLSDFPAGLARATFAFSMGLVLYRAKLKVPAVPAGFLLVLLIVMLALPVEGAALDILFIFVAAPALVLFGASTEPKGWLAKVAHALGLMSFPLYAIHYPILQLAKPLTKQFDLAPIPVGIGCCVMILLVCPLIVRFWDRPLGALLSRFIEQKRPSAG